MFQVICLQVINRCIVTLSYYRFWIFLPYHVVSICRYQMTSILLWCIGLLWEAWNSIEIFHPRFCMYLFSPRSCLSPPLIYSGINNAKYESVRSCSLLEHIYIYIYIYMSLILCSLMSTYSALHFVQGAFVLLLHLRTRDQVLLPNIAVNRTWVV